MKRLFTLAVLLLACTPAFGAVVQNSWVTNSDAVLPPPPLVLTNGNVAPVVFSNTVAISYGPEYPFGFFNANPIQGIASLGDSALSENGTFLRVNDLTTQTITISARNGTTFYGPVSGSFNVTGGNALTNNEQATFSSYAYPMLQSYVKTTYTAGNTNTYWIFGANASLPDFTIDYYTNGVFIRRYEFTPEGPFVTTEGFSDNGSSYPGSNVFNFPLNATNAGNFINGNISGNGSSLTNNNGALATIVSGSSLVSSNQAALIAAISAAGGSGGTQLTEPILLQPSMAQDWNYWNLQGNEPNQPLINNGSAPAFNNFCAIVASIFSCTCTNGTFTFVPWATWTNGTSTATVTNRGEFGLSYGTDLNALTTLPYPIFQPNPTPNKWDSGAVAAPHAFSFMGTNFILYAGGTNMSFETQLRGLGLAYLQPGSNPTNPLSWVRWPGNPILTNYGQVTTTPGTNFDSYIMYWGDIVTNGNLTYLFWNGSTNIEGAPGSTEAIGGAVSANGLAGPFIRFTNNPVVTFQNGSLNICSDPHIHKTQTSDGNTVWAMVLDDNLNGFMHIRYSTDLTNWPISSDQLITVYGASSYEIRGDPFWDGSRWRMLFDDATRIYLADSCPAMSNNAIYSTYANFANVTIDPESYPGPSWPNLILRRGNAANFIEMYDLNGGGQAWGIQQYFNKSLQFGFGGNYGNETPMFQLQTNGLNILAANGGVIISSNTFNINLATNGMPNGSDLTTSSNSSMVVIHIGEGLSTEILSISTNGNVTANGFSSGVSNTLQVATFSIGTSVTTFLTNNYGYDLMIGFTGTTITGVGLCPTNGGVTSQFNAWQVPLTGGSVPLRNGATVSFTNGITAGNGTRIPYP